MSLNDVWVCQACGRASKEIEEYPRPKFCYGCGAFQFLDHHLHDSDFGKHFGPFEPEVMVGDKKFAVEFPGDLYYDPWTGDSIPWDKDITVECPTLARWQLAQMEKV